MKIIFFSVFLMLMGCSGISRMDAIQVPLSVDDGVYIPIGPDGSHEGIQQPASDMSSQSRCMVPYNCMRIRCG